MNDIAGRNPWHDLNSESPIDPEEHSRLLAVIEDYYQRFAISTPYDAGEWRAKEWYKLDLRLRGETDVRAKADKQYPYIPWQ